jgi:hypothetical protein
MATADVKHVLDLPADLPTRKAVGDELQQLTIGEGEQPAGGVSAVRTGMGRRTERLYAERDAMADRKGLAVPQYDGPLLAIRGLIQKWADSRIPGKTAAEKILMEELADLMGKAGVDESGNIAFHHVENPSEDDRIPFSDLSKIYAKMAEFTPARGASGIESRAYRAVVKALRQTILAAESADPDVSALGSEARVAHGAERDFELQTRRPVMAGSVTPEAAATKVFPFGEKADLTHAKRVLLLSAEPQQEAYRMGWWRALIEASTDKRTGMVDFASLRKNWGQVPDDFKTLMAAGSRPEAGARLNELLARHRTLEDLSIADDARIDQLLSAKDLADDELKAANKATTDAIHAMEKAQRYAERLGTQRGAQLRTAATGVQRAYREGTEATRAAEEAAQQSLIAQPGRMMDWGRKRMMLYTALAASSAASLFVPGIGRARAAMIYGPLAWQMIKRPLTAAEAMMTVRDTVDGMRLAAIIAGTSQGWRGVMESKQQAPQSVAQRPAARLGP